MVLYSNWANVINILFYKIIGFLNVQRYKNKKIKIILHKLNKFIKFVINIFII